MLLLISVPEYLLRTTVKKGQEHKLYSKSVNRRSSFTIFPQNVKKSSRQIKTGDFQSFRNKLKNLDDINNDERSEMENPNKVRVYTRKLLQDPGTTTAKPESSDEGLSVAWIAAIVINVILIVVFIIVVIWCYCRNKKQRRLSRTGSVERNYRGDPDIMYVEKANHHMKGSEKTALIRPDTVYTVEGDRGKHKSHPDDNYDVSKDRCTCNSPQCYCSVGDEEIGTTSPRGLEQRFEEDEEEEVSEPHIPSPEPEPRFQTPEHFEGPIEEEEEEDDWRPESEKEEEREEETYIPGVITPEPEVPLEKQFLVYKVTDSDGSRDIIGQVVLTGDVTLNKLRRLIQRDNQLATLIDRKKYNFLDEDMKAISSFQESTLDVDRVFPSQTINIQYEKKPKIAKKPKLPAYVGPLGICSAEDCTSAARLKCLDCGTTAYCSTRCMRLDKAAHQKACYKPPWRV